MEENKENGKNASVLREEKILEFWKENNIFEKSLIKNSPKGEYVFYEGPPTANGKPGIHHLEARAFKDVIPRYKTMQGYHVRRKGGWDTHGLPVELQVEKKLGLSSKKAIEEYGIAKFNHECKASVWEYVDLWEKFTERIGYWVDQKNPYVTYHNDYIESVWNVLKKVDEQKLLYKDYKVVPWCPRCGTVLSSHELAQGYEDVKDLSVYAKFKVTKTSVSVFANGLAELRVPKGQNLGEEIRGPEQKQLNEVFILAWTTTPWTLLGNVALAVGADIDYVLVKVADEYFFLAKNRLSILSDAYEIILELKGKDLVDLEYEPLYPYLQNTISNSEKPKLEKAFKVYSGDFVTTEDGTGIVHTAVMYGQDDFELGTKVGLPKHHLVGLDGKYLAGTGPFEGKFVRDEEVAVDIIKDLAHRGLLFKKEKYEHPYPHCWRCHTALIYYARDSWYIKMTDEKIKNQLIKENESINWEPAHIKEGRFGEWLKDIKDWAISRERYWGTPLPVWICNKCKNIEVIGSIDQLKSKTKKSGNKYFVMRHGQAKNNVDEFFTGNPEQGFPLTENGRKEVLESIKEFKEKIDVIISSPYERAKETAEIACEYINYPKDKIIYKNEIRELDISSEFVGKTHKEVQQCYDHDYIYAPKKNFSDGENFAQVVERMGKFIYDINSKYSNKNILIIGHGIANRALQFVVNGFSFNDLIKKNPLVQLNNAEIKKFDFVPLPHNENYELDLHKPYIDEVKLVCTHAVAGQACGGELVRTKEVMDVWLDSGCMPFAQEHYPFENKKWIDTIGYPADFISEAIDQTRGWFYTLHAVGILMGRGKAFKNVICLGHLLDAQGKKMSKSLGNIVDPWDMIEKYGADTLRLWMYSVNQPGESKNFDEKTVSLLHQQVFGLLYNVLAFYELYRDAEIKTDDRPKSNNILDQWILARMDELTDLTTRHLDNYKLLEPTRALRDFIGDLSTWYLRRSRDRIKNGDKEAKATLSFILKILAKLMSPFAPLSAEDIYLKLKNASDPESVHLCKWPHSKRFKFGNSKVLESMGKVREIVTLGLEARQKAGIKVRQPLNKLQITNYKLPDAYTEIIKDELNIKEVEFVKGSDQKVELDAHITPELRQEGQYRELIRAVQDMRKKQGLNPNDVVTISIQTSAEGQDLINKFKSEFLKTVSAKEIQIKENQGTEMKIDELVFVISID
ncbi:MAG TPA: class I tRNA ligase family protein [Candidatus Paceibacterota bacterium]|nr:class I tRNA ligase family protein [Candidatus Paceibacterota bacterium]